MFCSDTTLSNLNGFSSFFFEHARNIIPDTSVSLEYFSSPGEQFYFVISPVRGQLHQFPCLASNTSHNRSVFFSTQSQNYSGHFCNFRIFCIIEGTSPFSHGEHFFLQKRIWCTSSNTALFCLVLFCTLSQNKLEDICLFRLFYFYRGPVIFAKIEQSSCRT